MHSLILTLGHGSSAVLIIDNIIVNGYMNERITKKKSDSAFPLEAIEEIMKHADIPSNVTIYVSHWEPTANLDKMSKRHWNPEYLARRFPNHTLKTLSIDFTHHRAHAYSALAYFSSEIEFYNLKENKYIIVADGFGNFGEVFSIYEVDNGVPIPIFSCHNYNASLGLLYQYCTDYVGLKMNQDEWKLNAAATHIDSTELYPLSQISLEIAEEYIDKLTNPIVNSGDPMVELGALSFTHKMVVGKISKWFKPTDKEKIAFVLQNVVEICIEHFIRMFNIKNVYLVGGVFMNVQLNGHIADIIEGDVGVMPLSGDNGAGLGLYKYYNPDFILPDSLCWGIRDLSGIKCEGVIYTNNLKRDLDYFLSRNMIVNVVRGAMEFGERAYCNTSTIALPTKENSKLINKANGRDQTMPMAPVIDSDYYDKLFNNTHKVVKSVQHMIMAMPYKEYKSGYNGISHFVPKTSQYTGRPQVVNSQHYMYDICRNFGPLINTSFNIHGQPICMNAADVLKAHEFQRKSDHGRNFITLIEDVKWTSLNT